MSIVDLDYVSSSNNDNQVQDPASVIVLKRNIEYISKLIKRHNSFDAIDHNSKLSYEQQVQVNIQLVVYLRQIKNDLSKELEGVIHG